MNTAPEVVTWQVVAELVGPHGGLPLEAELRYDTSDPYAVVVAFLLGSRDVEWVFGRELLIRGVAEPTGEGDVSVSPSLDADGRAMVVLLLRSPSGNAVVQVPSRDVIAFLARSTMAVWPGTEGDHISPDEAIAAILVGD